MEQPTVVTIDRWSLCRGGPWSSLQWSLLTGGPYVEVAHGAAYSGHYRQVVLM